MLKQMKQFLRDEEGATAIEYGLIVGLIAVVLIAAFTLLGTDLGTLFTDVANKVPDVPT
ncbi:Flp family type IVb pilin [Algiphilus sp. W345]|uniref:Flp family type IVb pilin n=1 Tax=Banduia mediterranea TaxID=3075609 RepID=A0ABU2WFW4_9GAMM|nr:Flp family type IVb pilin [Algiphilus sp. W345]MDT0496758.1 Flp family type IVb pilin [Algiphilus sp. W345]